MWYEIRSDVQIVGETIVENPPRLIYASFEKEPAGVSKFQISIASHILDPGFSTRKVTAGHTLARSYGQPLTWQASWWSRFHWDVSELSRYRTNIAGLVTNLQFLYA